MATRANIEFDFLRAKEQARQLEVIAENLGSLAKDSMNDSMQVLAQNWKSDTSSAYLSKENTLQNNISMSASELHRIAADIRTIAQNIYNAEMAALRIAEQRKY